MKKIQGEGIDNLTAQLAANNKELEEIRMRRLLRLQNIMAVTCIRSSHLHFITTNTYLHA